MFFIYSFADWKSQGIFIELKPTTTQPKYKEHKIVFYSIVWHFFLVRPPFKRAEQNKKREENKRGKNNNTIEKYMYHEIDHYNQLQHD